MASNDLIAAYRRLIYLHRQEPNATGIKAWDHERKIAACSEVINRFEPKRSI